MPDYDVQTGSVAPIDIHTLLARRLAQWEAMQVLAETMARMAAEAITDLNQAKELAAIELN